MIILGKAVLAFGIFSVFGAAVHNHSLVGLQVAGFTIAPVRASAPVIEEAGLTIAVATAHLPRGYWSNPSTSPLQGIGLSVMQSAGPIGQLNIAWHVEVRSEPVSDRIQFAAHLQSADSN